MNLAVLIGRGAEDDVRTSCQHSRNAQHEDGRKQRGRASRNVQPHFFYGNVLSPAHNSRHGFHRRFLMYLRLVKGPDVVGGYCDGFL